MDVEVPVGTGFPYLQVTYCIKKNLLRMLREYLISVIFTLLLQDVYLQKDDLIRTVPIL